MGQRLRRMWWVGAGQVVAAEWSAAPDYRTPHRVTLEAALDNLVEPEDLPLAPWY